MPGKLDVLFLHRQGFFYASDLQRKIFEAKFQPNVIQDLEIVSEDELNKLIRQFIEENKIQPSHMVIVLANNVSIVKDFIPVHVDGADETKREETVIALEEDIKKFIAHAPFENVVAKRLPFKDGFRVSVVSQNFYETFRRVFQKYNFTTDMVIPSLFFGDEIYGKIQLDLKTAEEILNKINNVRQHNLLLLQGISPSFELNNNPEHEEEKSEQKPPNPNTRTFILVGVFLLLLLALGIVYFMSQKSVPPKKAPVVVAPTIAIPTPLLSPTTTSSQAAIPRASLSVQITGNGQDIQKLKQQLISDGFTSVTTVENSSVASSGTIITFSPRVTTDNQNIIVADAKKVTSKTIQAQTNPTATIDVSILLSK